MLCCPTLCLYVDVELRQPSLISFMYSSSSKSASVIPHLAGARQLFGGVGFLCAAFSKSLFSRLELLPYVGSDRRWETA